MTSFYKQNCYLEYDALSRLGIFEHKSYLKKQFANEQMVALNSCVVSKKIIERTEMYIDECILSKSYVDLQANLPSVLNNKDLTVILDKVLLDQKRKQVIVIDSFVISKLFIDELALNCDSILKENAKNVVESGKYQQYEISLTVANRSSKSAGDLDETKLDKREERRKKATGGKSGGGTQGRETKTKSTKKLYRSAKTVESDYPEVEDKKENLVVISLDEIKGAIQATLEEHGLDEILEYISDYLFPILNETGIKLASEIFVTTVVDQTAIRRITHNDIQNKVNALMGDVRLFEKGLKLLPPDVQVQLYKYLLKSICTDIVVELLNYVSVEEGVSTTTNNLTNEQRIKFIHDLPSSYREALTKLIKSLSAQNIDDFNGSIEEALVLCNMIIKKIDKKKDRVTVLNHKHSLLEALQKHEDPALVLHLAVLIIFIGATQCMVHASGRHVASILLYLKQYLSDEQVAELNSFHGK